MNNVWTTIAFRVPCAARQPRRAPLLQLFNGYARWQRSSISSSNSRGRQDCAQSAQRSAVCNSSVQRQFIGTAYSSRLKHAFSTSTAVSTRNRPSTRRQRPEIPNDSRLEPAQTVATHTEGLPEQPEELTWRDYDPAGGMPIPGGERSQAQINGIFGNEDIDADTGNYILNVMHWRRMSGALIDVGVDFPKDSGVSREQAIKGLEYVRPLVPELDEQGAGEVWAEEESHRLQEELSDRAVKLRLYKRDEQFGEESDLESGSDRQLEPELDQGTEYGRQRTQESQLQRIREENEARFEASEALKAEAEAKAESAAMATHRGPLELSGGVQPSVSLITYTGRDGITISRPETKAWLLPVQRKPWVKYYEEQAQIIRDNSVPQLSLLRRLGPSLLMLVAVFAAAIYLSNHYTPPPTSARIWPETSPAVATLTALTATLATFFILSRLPPFWRILSKYFTLIPVYPNAVSLVGCAFRHQPLSHLLINTASLWFFGLILHEDVGRGTFLAIFFASGALGAYTSLTYHVLRRNWTAYIFGSSGCVLGVVSAACMLRPNSTIKIAGQEIPIAVWVWLAVWGAAEVVAMWRFRGIGVDHAGHVGGLAAGFLAGTVLRRRGRLEESRDSILRAEEEGKGYEVVGEAPVS